MDGIKILFEGKVFENFNVSNGDNWNAEDTNFSRFARIFIFFNCNVLNRTSVRDKNTFHHRLNRFHEISQIFLDFQCLKSKKNL
jgi:hypothetical protein